jgi:hypothetical protein
MWTANDYLFTFQQQQAFLLAAFSILPQAHAGLWELSYTLSHTHSIFSKRLACIHSL